LSDNTAAFRSHAAGEEAEKQNIPRSRTTPQNDTAHMACRKHGGSPPSINFDFGSQALA
jgi:hypothetical protein